MKKTLSISLCLFLSAATFAQHEDALKYAETITEDDLREYLGILASDAMEGRETGERGQKMAAAFIAYQFEAFGLEPVVPDGDSKSYYQEFDLVSSSPGETYITFGDSKKVNGTDLLYYGNQNMSSKKTHEAVFLGSGSEQSFTEVNPDGKISVIWAVGKGFQQWRGLIEKSSQANSVLTLLVVSDTEEKFAGMMNQLRGFLMGSSLGFKANDSGGSGTFFISSAQASELFDTTEEKLTTAVESFDGGKSSALKKLKRSDVEFLITRNEDIVTTENVMGYIEGTDLKDEVVVISAHYDHIGRNETDIFNGADDDGSGTSSVLEIAQAFSMAKADGKGPRRSMLFLMVTGEEKGLLGSQYYVENPIFPLEKTVVDLNIDMIGRYDGDHAENKEFVYLVGSDRLSTELHDLSEKANETFTGLSLDYTYNDEDHPERIYYRSDHWNFAKNGIPIIFYFTGLHEDYHRATDTIDKIEFELLDKRAQLIYHTAWILSNRDERVVVDKLQDTEIQGNN